MDVIESLSTRPPKDKKTAKAARHSLRDNREISKNKDAGKKSRFALPFKGARKDTTTKPTSLSSNNAASKLTRNVSEGAPDVALRNKKPRLSVQSTIVSRSEDILDVPRERYRRVSNADKLKRNPMFESSEAIPTHTPKVVDQITELRQESANVIKMRRLEQATVELGASLKQMFDFCTSEQDYLARQKAINPNPYLSALYKPTPNKKIEKFLELEIKKKVVNPEYRGPIAVHGPAQAIFWKQIDATYLKPFSYQRQFLSILAQALSVVIRTLSILHVTLSGDLARKAQNITDFQIEVLQEADVPAIGKDICDLWNHKELREIAEGQVLLFDPKREIILYLLENAKTIFSSKYTPNHDPDYQYLQRLLAPFIHEISIKFSNLEYKIIRTDRVQGYPKKWMNLFVENEIALFFLDISTPSAAKNSFAEFSTAIEVLKVNALLFLFFFGSKDIQNISPAELSEHFSGYSSEKSVTVFLEDRFKKKVDVSMESKIVSIMAEPSDNIVEIVRKKTQECVREEEKEMVLHLV